MITEQEMFLDVFQRVYSWNKDQCDELWGDILRAGRTSNTHFIGTLLYSEDSGDNGGTVHLSIIDGQQRTATLTLLLAALERRLRETGASIGHVDADFVRDNLLFVGGEHKLVLSRTDRKTLFAILDGGELPERVSERVVENFEFFCAKTREEGFDPGDLWAGMQQLLLISANLTDEDNPQLIFESLNSRGTPLTVGDLVRNYLLLAQTHEEQTRLYDEYWDPIEGMFQPDPGSLRLDNAIQGWLSVRFRKVRARGRDEVYSVFKQYVEDEFTGTTESLLHELRNFCMIWAENYRYHAVKKYKSAFKWAENGAPTLVSHYEKKQSTNQVFADATRAKMDATDASL